jgi:hypothetical protein
MTTMRQLQTEQHDERAARTLASDPTRADLQETEAFLEVSADAAIGLIHELSTAVRRRKRALSWLPVPIIITPTAVLAGLKLLAIGATGIVPVYQALLAATAVGSASLATLLFFGVNRLNKSVRALSDLDDIRAVGVMAESLSAGEPALSIAGSVLIRILPRMSRLDLERLTPEQRQCLLQGMLNSTSGLKYTYYNPALAIAILRALERIGDTTDAAAVKRLINRKAITPQQKSIREAAEKCLASLTTRSLSEMGTNVVWMEARLNQKEDNDLSAEAAGILSKKLGRIARIRRRNVSITAAGSVAGTVLAFLSIRIFAAGLPVHPVFTGGMLGSLATMIVFALSGTYAQRNLTNSLIHSDDLRIVPPLIQAAATVEISGTAAVMLLTRLLTRMRASDAGLLNPEDRTLLHTAMIKHSHNREFVLASLQALQQIGDVASIPTVQRLAEPTYWRAADPAVRGAALECLEFLKQRAALAEANQTLLRASDAGANSTEMLLRPVDNAIPIASGEMLRSTAAPIVYEQSESADIQQQNTQSFALQPTG